MRFDAYEPSTAEVQWTGLVRRENPLSCGAWSARSPLGQLLADSADSVLSAPPASHLLFTDDAGVRRRSPIEPLVASLRHPLLCAPGNATRERMMDKGFILLPSINGLRRVGHRARRAILVDLGAGLYASGGSRGEPGSSGGGGLHWLINSFRERGVDFDRIFAWEARRLNPATLWGSIPPELVGKISYFNTPVTSEPGGAHNPWRVLASVATPEDYVAVKIDIDHSPTELALVDQVPRGGAVVVAPRAPGPSPPLAVCVAAQTRGLRAQILDDASPVRGLIDELFWEHHVTGSLAACPRMWRYPHGMGWSKMRFNASRADHTLAGSYDLFRRMCERGIRAHSWV